MSFAFAVAAYREFCAGLQQTLSGPINSAALAQDEVCVIAGQACGDSNVTLVAYVSAIRRFAQNRLPMAADAGIALMMLSVFNNGAVNSKTTMRISQLINDWQNLTERLVFRR